jgi:hypothetical protein
LGLKRRSSLISEPASPRGWYVKDDISPKYVQEYAISEDETRVEATSALALGYCCCGVVVVVAAKTKLGYTPAALMYEAAIGRD